jgi:hypothetical protein
MAVGNASYVVATALDARNLRVECRGSIVGAGSALRSGPLLIQGRAGNAIGYTQAGGNRVLLVPMSRLAPECTPGGLHGGRRIRLTAIKHASAPLDSSHVRAHQQAIHELNL